MTLVRFARPKLPVLEWETIVGTTKARRSGRSWWALRFTDGRIIHEWDTDSGSPNGHADWPRVPYQGRQALRLYCPNGQMAELGGTRDATGRFFQFKIAYMTGGGGPGIVGRDTLAHVIGVIAGVNGECLCYAWEPLPGGSGRLVGPWDDNTYGIRYHNVGPISADHLGVDDGEGR